MKLYQFLAQQLARVERLDENVWGHYAHDAYKEAEADIEALVKERFPSGSGFDSGTQLDFAKCQHGKRLVFNTAFHHMDEHGGYDGWTAHEVWVTPSLQWGFDIRITGRDRNDIKTLIHESFEYILNADEDFKFQH